MESCQPIKKLKDKKKKKNFFAKIMPFMRECGKMWYSLTGHR
jgi:hypothetical protein